MKGKQMNIDKTQYKQDAKGNLVPLANIKEIDLLRDELVQEIAAKARAVQDNLMAFKREAMDDIAAFVQLSADRYLLAARKAISACTALTARTASTLPCRTRWYSTKV